MAIAIHVFDGISLFHVSVPLLVFGEAARLDPDGGWETRLWAPGSTSIRTAEGQTLGELDSSASPGDADMVVFAAWAEALPDPAARLVGETRRAHARGAVIAGLCLGAFPVVAAGLLDGRSAVTHWARTDELAVRYPEVAVDAAALYIDHGDVLTSAGTASGLDACLHLVRSRLGAAAAATIARQIVIAPHREGDQAQYIRRPVAPPDAPDDLSQAMRWALSHLDQQITVDELAARSHMSPRHFARRFRETAGASPAAWIRARRLDAARELLESGELTIAGVAQAVGFASPVTFRQGFTSAYGTTPTSYRHRFLDAHDRGAVEK